MSINIRRPLPSSINLCINGTVRRFGLIYEGLYEICIFHGTLDHDLDHCPLVHNAADLDVVVERFERSLAIKGSEGSVAIL